MQSVKNFCAYIAITSYNQGKWARHLVFHLAFTNWTTCANVVFVIGSILRVDGQASPQWAHIFSPFTTYARCSMGVCYSPLWMSYGFVDFPCNIHEKTRTHHCKRKRRCRNTNYVIDLHHNYEVVDENISILSKFIKGLHGL